MMVVAAAMTLVVVAVRLAIVVDDAARAPIAADAAALAGAAAGEPVARDLAERNGAELLSFEHTWRGARAGDAQVKAEASASTFWVRRSG
ncbi:MAG TPA: hypothetical protein DEA70_10995 [Acidimicrobiaceae bacterium]|nr:hypothetical protein [Acidimicrobiaceae bacterium]